MKLFIFLTLFSSSYALFGFFESKTTVSPKKIALGSEIGIPHTDENSETGEIEIPFNEKPKVGGVVTTRSTVDVRRFTTTTMNPRFTAATKALPSSDRHPSSGCPNRIDAYSFGPQVDYAFSDETVYSISNNRISSRTKISEEFPNGPRTVNGALYDLEREIFWLLSEKSVYGYKKGPQSEKWSLQSVFPKELPSSVPFTPEAAVRWHNKHQVLLSNGGKFALYDEYWNKSLLSGRTQSYFENLPDRVRGISEWSPSGSAHIFTQSLVFEYSADKKKVVGDGVALGDFWRC